VPALARKAPKPATPAVPAVLPRLVDLGAGKCIPCKRMAPILEALKIDYAGTVNVQFIDVWKDPAAGTPYKIRLIPTQVFFDRTGRERFRHEGFFGREEIERIFRDSLGVKLRPAAK
jgi:thioredoxin 1